VRLGKRTRALLAVLTVTAVANALWAGCGRPDTAGPAPRTQSIHAMLVSDGAEGFTPVTSPARLAFPRDHGPHDAFRIEWWYFTGSLSADSGREFGYQLTFFRRALTASADPHASAWATSQMYMAHFALTDIHGAAHEAYERVSRGAAGLAGAEAAPFRVWVDDWRARSTGPGLFPIRVVARDGDDAIELLLTAAKPIVLHGDGGLSQKTRDGRAASYYYSFTRVNTEGEIVVGGTRHEVTGASWIDREWSTSVLDENHTGWDWFSLQFDDGTELMCFRMRHTDGLGASHIAGTFVDDAGRARSLAGHDIAIKEIDSWTSVTSGATYPSNWRIRVTSEGIDATVVASADDQEMLLSFRYWEGAVRAVGSRRGARTTGRGYVEMTGYGDSGAAGKP